MGKKKTTYYIDEGVLTATKLTAVATHQSESALVEEALRSYLDDEASMALAVKEVRAVRGEREQRRSRAAG